MKTDESVGETVAIKEMLVTIQCLVTTNIVNLTFKFLVSWLDLDLIVTQSWVNWFKKSVKPTENTLFHLL